MHRDVRGHVHTGMCVGMGVRTDMCTDMRTDVDTEDLTRVYRNGTCRVLGMVPGE